MPPIQRQMNADSCFFPLCYFIRIRHNIIWPIKGITCVLTMSNVSAKECRSACSWHILYLHSSQWKVIEYVLPCSVLMEKSFLGTIIDSNFRQMWSLHYFYHVLWLMKKGENEIKD